MPQARKPAAAEPKSKAAAAQAEVAEEPQPRIVEHDGMRLTLPDEFPPEVMFDMIESEATSAENGANEYLVNLRLLRSLVGPDQFTEIRHRIGSDPEKVIDLVGAVLGAFGMTMGEPDLSDDS